MYNLVRTSYNFQQTNDNKKYKERQRTTSWMNAVLILLSIFSHIAGHFMAVEVHETWWVLVAILTNCLVNFYLYCLSGHAFQQQIKPILRQLAEHNLEKFRVRQQRLKQNHRKENSFQYRYDRCVNTNQRSLRLNSSDHINEDDSLV